MKDIMIDIETLSTNSNSVILTLGAVKFNRGKDIELLENCETFYRRINLDSCMNLGMKMDNETLNWWLEQSNEAKYEALENKDRQDIKFVLKEFSEWVGNINNYIWGHGDDFDCVILDNAYKCCGIQTPWKFWNTRDTRTLFDITKVNLKDVHSEHEHNSLHDAYRQVKCVKLAFTKFNLL